MNDDPYEAAALAFWAAYQNVMAEKPSRETAIRERAAIVARLQVQAKHLRIADELRPTLNGRASAYADIIEETA
jgi:hypothetical protein